MLNDEELQKFLSDYYTVPFNPIQAFIEQAVSPFILPLVTLADYSEKLINHITHYLYDLLRY